MQFSSMPALQSEKGHFGPWCVVMKKQGTAQGTLKSFWTLTRSMTVEMSFQGFL